MAGETATDAPTGTAATSGAPLDELEQAVRHLAAIERPSASAGERQAAEWIAERLRAHGCQARVEEAPAHGGYWWPLGLLNAGAALAGAAALRRPRSRAARAVAALVGGAAAAAVWDDVSGGRLWFRRAALPHRTTWNVVAEAGDPDGERTVVLIAHHDAAHSGLVFHPGLAEFAVRRFPKQHARATQSVPIMYAVWLGPALVAGGSLAGVRRAIGAGAALALGAAAAMANIGASQVVPGANDNLSAVAVLLGIARAVREQPVEGVRVLLVSTGSEESFMEGMQGFARAHFEHLDRETTDMLCLECVGSPTLQLVEGEGMLRMRDYSSETREALMDAARRADVKLPRRLRTVAATDALIAMRAGYRVATLASVDHTKFPANYHWPTDTPENLDWATIQQAVSVTEAFLRSRAQSAPAAD